MAISYRGLYYACKCGNSFVGGWYAPLIQDMSYYKCPQCGEMAPKASLNKEFKERAENIYMGEDMFLMRNPVKTFRNKGKEKLDTKKKVTEYCKRNDLVYGGDDLDQEADHQHIQQQKDKISQVEKAIDDVL